MDEIETFNLECFAQKKKKIGQFLKVIKLIHEVKVERRQELIRKEGGKQYGPIANVVVKLNGMIPYLNKTLERAPFNVNDKHNKVDAGVRLF